MVTPVTFQTLKEHHTWKVLGVEYRLGASIAVGLGLNTDAAFRTFAIGTTRWWLKYNVLVSVSGGPTNIREDLNLTAQKSCQVTNDGLSFR